MKKIMLVSVMILFALVAFGQSLKKGNLLGLHLEDVKLAAGVTIEQYTDFVINRYIPEYEKAFGSKAYVVKGIRGENNNQLGMIIIYGSEATRNKYFKADGTATEAGKIASRKIELLNKELAKLGTSNSKYTDWVVQ